MKLKIQNLGIVEEAVIDLDKDLIILCGPNNTGKTYVAYTIYGLMKSSANMSLEPNQFPIDISKIFTDGIIEIDLNQFIEDSKEGILNHIMLNYKKMLPSIFGSEQSFFKNTQLIFELTNLQKLKEIILRSEIERKMSFPQEQIVFTLTKPTESSILSCIFVSNKQDTLSIPRKILINILIEKISEVLFKFLFFNPYIAPAERTAINIFSKELSLNRYELVDQLLELKNLLTPEDSVDFLDEKATRYPLPIRDNLKIAEDLANLKKNKSEFAYFADEIEKTILQGKISISKDGEVLFKPSKKGSPQLTIHLTASVVKSLAHLVIYFRHLAKKQDFIIIDEPELNLHPDYQVIVARFLAKIVRQGFKVMISTHSDYIIRELNNLIMLSKKSVKTGKLLKKYKYSEDELLSPDQVGVYMFDGTGIATPLEVSETGFEVTSIDTVIHRQNERTQEIYFSLNG